MPAQWLGYLTNRQDAVVTVEEVRTFETRGGNLRFLLRDDAGNE